MTLNQELLLSAPVTTAVKCGLIFFLLVNIVPIMAWVERRGMALMQNRLGPNRIGPLGLLQSLADAIKFIFKEDRIPGHTKGFYYFMAPFISVVPAFMGMAAIPFASSITIGETTIQFQIAPLNVGLLYVLAVASLGVYGIIIGAWASNSKYALYGGLRSSAQMISYELAMGLSLLGAVAFYGTVDLMEIAKIQGQTFQIGGMAVPKWGIFMQPVGALIFLVCIFAETNRTPFDLAEGESEIVAGYHLEYGSMKFALFMMAEYVNMTTASAMMATIFLGGWQLLPGMPQLLHWLGSSGTLEGVWLEWTRVGLEFTSFITKVLAMMWFFVWVRWTVPRFRYDQLMALGWKVLLPLSLVNLIATALIIWAQRSF